eukprot:TRINITY_DN8554_c0_g6_i1.p1 TRINITY_DN8554_c0_g6~~TRINITY_DN8554_c0_g6_i1.p1  ORF type:complete len:313 (+),score=62.19 TRINITY_DN8554_c0_g6_i1:282-1220(+)
MAEGEAGNEIFSVRYSDDGNYLASGSASGTVRVYNATSNKLLSTLTGETLPITCLRWRPRERDVMVASVLVSACAGGDITYWHALSGKVIITIKEETPCDLYAMDFSGNGNLLAVGGKDYNVKIYDDNIKSLVSTLQATEANEGHSNRIFSIKFTENPNVLLSGGWDNSVFIWDIREKKSIGLLYGPHICGDAIDIKDDTILTGSYSNKDVLQLWSFSKRELMGSVSWNGNTVEGYDYGFLYATMFEKNGKYIAAGGAGNNEVHTFKNGKRYDILGKIMLDNTVTSIDFAQDKNMMAVGCGNGLTYSFKFKS